MTANQCFHLPRAEYKQIENENYNYSYHQDDSNYRFIRPTAEKRNGNRLVVIMMSHNFKLTRVILSTRNKVTQISTIFLDHCVMPCKGASYVLTDNRPYFERKFFSTLGLSWGSMQFSTAAYHIQSNVQAESYDHTLLSV